MDELLRCITGVFLIDPGVELSDDMGPSAVTGWDSVGWLNLLNAVEQQWDIELSLDEAAQLRTIGDIRRVIGEKTGNACGPGSAGDGP